MPVTEEMMAVQQKIADSFDCVEDWWADPDLGFKVMRLSGQFVRSVDLDEFISRVKSALPADAKLLLYNGAPLNITILKDLYMMVFGSKTWEKVPEGKELPTFYTAFVGETDGDPAPDPYMTCIYNPLRWVEMHVVVDKRTHTLSIPKETETDEQCVVIVRPRE